MTHLSIPFFFSRIVSFLLLATVLLACAQSNEPSLTTDKDAPLTTIYRDQYGTPHIFADDNYGVYYGYGYALATDRLFQLEMLKRTTEGRVSEVLGEKYLALDTHIRRSYDHRAISQQLDNADGKNKEVLDAYAAGFNYRINEVLKDKDGLLPAEFVFHDFSPEYWSAYDVAMVFIGSIAHRYSDFNSELDNLKLLKHLQQRHDKKTAWQIFNASKWLLDNHSPVTVANTQANGHVNDKGQAQSLVSADSYLDGMVARFSTRRVAIDKQGKFAGTTDFPLVAREFKQRIAEQGFTFSPEFTPASNFWGVGKGRLSEANGVFVNGPQFGFSLPSYVYGIGLHGGDFNVVGNTLLGLPTLLFAHNNTIGWGSTAGLSDQVDVFVEELHPENDEQYRHNGAYQQFESWQELIQVRDSEPVSITARRSVHGMVQQFDAKERVAFTRARAWEGGELDTLFAWIQLSKDESLDAARESIAAVTTNINFYTMDRQGQLAYIHAGRYPKRKEGQDSRLPTPGNGEWDWQGLRPYSENPMLHGGEQNSIVNWNNRPRNDWISSDLWTYTWGRGDRSTFIFEALAAKKTLTVDEVWAINRLVSDADVSAPFLLPYLFDAFANRSQPAIVVQALTELKNWNQRWQFEAQGGFGPAATIMETWLTVLLSDVFKDDIGDDYFHLYAATNNPNHVLGASMGTGPGTKALIRNLDGLTGKVVIDYDFFNGQDARGILRSSFIAALKQLQQMQGQDLAQWRIAAQPLQWKPYNFRGVPQALETQQSAQIMQLPAYMNRGSENNLFIADESGFTAYDVIPPGQSGFIQPNGKPSKHTDDQLGMFAQYHYKPVPFSRSEVENAAVSVKLISYQRP